MQPSPIIEDKKEADNEKELSKIQDQHHSFGILPNAEDFQHEITKKIVKDGAENEAVRNSIHSPSNQKQFSSQKVLKP